MSDQKTADGIPVLFADGVISQAYGGNVAKFYFGRVDPDPSGSASAPNAAPVLQVAMPIDGFVQMVAFLEMRLRVMVKRGVIAQQIIDRYRKEAAAMEPEVPHF